MTLTFPYVRDLRWLAGSFPLLRHLTISPHTYVTQSPAIEPFDDAPQLKIVALGLNFNPSEVVLPWLQLTSISAERIVPDVAANILRQATALVNLTCTLWAASATPRAVPPALHLQSLILRDAGNLTAPQQQLLDALTVPALRHLSISERELDDKPISTIVSFLNRSRCSLDSLHITHSLRRKTEFRAVFPLIKVIQVSRGK
jgi:hypothetical protein